MVSRKKQYRAEFDATILIVDDNADNRLLLGSQLGMQGYRIIEAADGYEGIDLAREKMPDLILLDVMMPFITGFEVCRQLKDDPEMAAIPVIIITALRDVEYRIQGIEAGADEFLSRPHNREELLVRVRSLIRLKFARAQLEHERHQLQLLNDVSRATTNTQLDLDQMMVEIITHTRAAVGAHKGSIMLFDEIGQVTHKILIREGLSPTMSENVTGAVMNKGLAGWILSHRQTAILADATVDERWLRLPDDTEEVGSVIGVPLTKNVVLGVLILIHPEPGYFTEQHATLLETIAGQVAVAINNAYLFNEVSEERRKLTTVLAQSTDSIITMDENARLVLLNNAAEKAFMLDSQAVIGRSIQRVPELSPLVPLVRRATDQPITAELQTENNLILFASVTPIPEVGFIAVMQDVTEMKRMEQMRLAQERREKERIRQTFSRYMSPRLVDEVLSNEPSLLGQRQRRHAVVMFADLRGFTRMIVGLNPDDSIAVLNEFFTEMTSVVYEFDGTIFDLAGDELMIGFNAPIDQEDAPYRAVLTAVSMQRRFDEARQDWFARTDTQLGLGVGIDEGDVVMGNVGAESRMNFQMVGEAVNTAHRLVDLAQDGQIVVSESIFGALQ
ncbi:MAG: response regulator, partial [Anaerolineales bacterium]|nr:response regulator [Anaerolineales bacterium]